MLAVFGAATWTAQLGALAIVGIFTVVGTLIIIYVVKLIFPIRVDLETETNGLDLSVHGERAYELNS
jgi:Amt family ammonium transporter